MASTIVISLARSLVFQLITKSTVRLTIKKSILEIISILFIFALIPLEGETSIWFLFYPFLLLVSRSPFYLTLFRRVVFFLFLALPVPLGSLARKTPK